MTNAAHDFSDLGRCYSYTIADERLRLRYVALESAIVEIVKAHDWAGISTSSVADMLNADPMVVADEVRQAVAHGKVRRCRDGSYETLRIAFAS